MALAQRQEARVVADLLQLCQRHQRRAARVQQLPTNHTPYTIVMHAEVKHDTRSTALLRLVGAIAAATYLFDLILLQDVSVDPLLIVRQEHPAHQVILPHHRRHAANTHT